MEYTSIPLYTIASYLDNIREDRYINSLKRMVRYVYMAYHRDEYRRDLPITGNMLDDIIRDTLGTDMVYMIISILSWLVMRKIQPGYEWALYRVTINNIERVVSLSVDGREIVDPYSNTNTILIYGQSIICNIDELDFIYERLGVEPLDMESYKDVVIDYIPPIYRHEILSMFYPNTDISSLARMYYFSNLYSILDTVFIYRISIILDKLLEVYKPIECRRRDVYKARRGILFPTDISFVTDV